jgi:hypothetical protein
MGKKVQSRFKEETSTQATFSRQEKEVNCCQGIMNDENSDLR